MDLRRSDFERTRSNGRSERHTPPRRFDLHYIVSVLTTNIEDEHELIWRVLLTLIQHPQIPQEVLSEELRAVEPPLSTQVSQADEGQRLAGIWNALGVPPRVALSYLVTVPIEMNMVIEAPLVLTRTARYRSGNQEMPEVTNQIGGIVRGATGEPLANVRVALEDRVTSTCETDEEGRFILKNVAAGTVKLRVTCADGTQRVVTVQVPLSSSQGPSNYEGPYDIVLEEAILL
jgi:Pvc16 N-terminal domain/Carboxypeptidase regulatory-like domain